MNRLVESVDDDTPRAWLENFRYAIKHSKMGFEELQIFYANHVFERRE